MPAEPSSIRASAVIHTTAGCRIPIGTPAGSDDCVVVPIGTSITDMERELIVATMDRCEGNKRYAANEAVPTNTTPVGVEGK